MIVIDAPLPASRYLGEAPVGGKETEIRPGFSMINLVPMAAMLSLVVVAVRSELGAEELRARTEDPAPTAAVG